MVRMRDEFLRAASKRDMLLRLLLNLKGLYVNARDARRTLSVTDRILMLRPGAANELRDSGLLLARLGRREQARERLRQYLEMAPEANDARRIRSMIEQLGREDGSPEIEWPEGRPEDMGRGS